MITMKKKLIAIIVGMMFCAELLGGCGNKNINKDNITTDTAEESKEQDSNKKQELPTATYMGGSNTITEVCDELGSAGASHVDTFKEWVTDFADSAGKNAKLKDTWSDAYKMKADTVKCMDGWEKKHDYSDADCRMTAFLLLDGLLHAQSTEDSYSGTYLMFQHSLHYYIQMVQPLSLLRNTQVLVKEYLIVHPYYSPLLPDMAAQMLFFLQTNNSHCTLSIHLYVPRT